MRCEGHSTSDSLNCRVCNESRTNARDIFNSAKSAERFQAYSVLIAVGMYFATGLANSGEVTMVRFNDRQRGVLIDKLPDTANVVLAGLLFGQALSGRIVAVALASVGIVGWAALRCRPTGCAERLRDLSAWPVTRESREIGHPIRSPATRSQ